MLKIGKYFRINILTILLLLICFFTKQYKFFLITYLIIFFHECFHLLSAKILGLRVDNITFHPFGVNLQLKNKIIYGLADEIILYASGPFFNAVCAIILLLLRGKSDVLDYLYACNLMLFVINILPILPLDGGVILRKIIAHFYGYHTAKRILCFSSLVLVLLLLTFEIYVGIKTGFNYSVLLMIAFLLGNIFSNNEKYDIDFLQELMFSDIKDSVNAKVFVAGDNTDYKDIVKRFVNGKYGVVLKINKEGEIIEVLTERQIVKKLIE